MKKINENEYIEKFARRWNEKLTDFTTSEEDERKNYVGWVNLKHMLKIFLNGYKKRVG